jgi:hypothetical protein
MERREAVLSKISVIDLMVNNITNSVGALALRQLSFITSI